MHEVWDNSALEEIGFDMNKNEDPKKNYISFLTLYKARSILFPTKPEILTNY